MKDAFFFSTFFLGAAFLIALPEACALCGLPLAALALIFLFLSNAGMPILETLADRPILAASTFRERKQAARGEPGRAIVVERVRGMENERTDSAHDHSGRLADRHTTPYKL